MGRIKYIDPYDVIECNINISPDGCWDWTGCLDKKGYGYISTLRWAKKLNVTRAHRFSYICFKGDFDRELFICHRCHNRACVNPAHLYAGTAKDNIGDMHRAGRNNNVSGEQHGRSKLKAIDAVDIKSRLLRGEKSRDIAKFYGVGEKCISKIKLGLRWKHIIVKEC